MVEAVQGMRKRAFIRSLSVHSPIAPHIVVIDHGRREDNCVDEDVAEVQAEDGGDNAGEGGHEALGVEASARPFARPVVPVVRAAPRRRTGFVLVP